MAAAPLPTRAGVLGMARTTGGRLSQPGLSERRVTPAAMESTRRLPTARSDAQATSASAGLTASTAPPDQAEPPDRAAGCPPPGRPHAGRPARSRRVGVDLDHYQRAPGAPTRCGPARPPGPPPSCRRPPPSTKDRTPCEPTLAATRRPGISTRQPPASSVHPGGATRAAARAARAGGGSYFPERT